MRLFLSCILTNDKWIPQDCASDIQLARPFYSHSTGQRTGLSLPPFSLPSPNENDYVRCRKHTVPTRGRKRERNSIYPMRHLINKVQTLFHPNSHRDRDLRPWYSKRVSLSMRKQHRNNQTDTLKNFNEIICHGSGNKGINIQEIC